mgnify:CR=1 FL=1
MYWFDLSNGYCVAIFGIWSGSYTPLVPVPWTVA